MHILSVVMIRYVITDKAAVGSQGNDVIGIVPNTRGHADENLIIWQMV